MHRPLTDEEIAHEEAMDELCREIEKTWERPRLTTDDLKEAFPEILEIAPPRVRELEYKVNTLEKFYNDNPLHSDSLENIWEIERRENEIKELKRQLMRFKRFLPETYDANGLSEAQIQEAREFPITDLVEAPRRSGKTYKILCPLHDERTPSCNIYTDTNHFWCFGCNQGGNAIDLVMMRDEVDFVTAVKQLTGVSNESIS